MFETRELENNRMGRKMQNRTIAATRHPAQKNGQRTKRTTRKEL